MKILLLLDNKINEAQLKQVKKEVAGIYKKNGVEISFTDEWRDFSNVPKEWYDKEAEGVQRAYIDKVAKEIYARYEEEVDQVVFFIHRDHWNLTGVWGWNLSKVYSGYGVQQCRFDSRNTANSVGTLYHEMMHDHDAFIYTYTGVVVENIVNVVDFDDDVVHGGKYSKRDFGYSYIRYNENQAALFAISKHLNDAVKKRRSVYLKKTLSYLQEIVRLTEKVAILRRQLVTQRRKDLKITPSQCLHRSTKQSQRF